MNIEKIGPVGPTGQGAGITAAALSLKATGRPGLTGEHASPSARLGHRSWRNFARHFFEMVAAMVVGMATLGGLVSLMLWLLGQGGLFDYLPVRTLVMATNMSIGMGLWMRHRGHAWSRIAEMSVAMYAPFLALLGPYAAGLVGPGPLMGGGHLLMLAAMLLVMLPRYQEYSQDHSAHCRSGAAQHEACHQEDRTVDA